MSPIEYAVIFDMDGVLVDSHCGIWKSFNDLLGRYGVHLNDEDIKLYCGVSLRDDIRLWNKKYGLNLDLESFKKEAWQIEARHLEGMNPDSGLLALLDELESHNIPRGVGTSSERFRADLILDKLKLRRYFSEVITANDVSKHKPEPDIFLEVAKRLAVPAQRCLVIEDAASGIEAAKRSRMKAIGYYNGHNSLEDLAKADMIIRDLRELNYGIIRQMFV